MSRRHPQVAFDAEAIASFLGNRKVLSCELLSGGACNSNYRIQISGDEEYVVRFYNRGSVEFDRYILGLVKDVVPAPEIVDAGDGWAVMRFLPGVSLFETPDAVSAAGRILAQIGSIHFDRPGQIFADGSIRPFPFGGGQGFIHCWLGKPEVRKWLGAETVRGVERLVERESARFAELDEESSLVHGDFNPGNILVSGGAVTGVLDWEFAHAGSPFMDIGNLMRHLGPAGAESLSAGLREGGMHLPPDWREKAALVDLTALLEFLTSGHSDDFKHRCVARVRELVGLPT